MSCPTCGVSDRASWSTSSLTSWLTSRTSSEVAPTRNISFVRHHVELPEWLKDLDKAVKAAWPTRFIDYPTVAVLLLSWEDTDMIYANKEIRRLKSVLTKKYGAKVEHWMIPSRDADFKAMDKVRGFLEQYGKPENLLLVYYAGHARPGNVPGSPPVWHAKASIDDCEELDTGTIQQMLTRAREDSPDVLLIHDCCHPLSATPSNLRQNRAVVECIFAGGFEAKVPVSGPDSFTCALTDELSVASSTGEIISVVELHRRLICRLVNWQPRPVFDKNDELREDETGRTIITTASRVTPAHLFLSKRDRTIKLIPISAKKSKQPIRNPEIQDKDPDSAQWPKTMLAVQLKDNERNLEDLKSWLLEAPPGVVEFCGIHPSFSSLLLIAVPIPVWDLLPDSNAVSFVGFTSGPQALLPEVRALERPATVQHSDTCAPDLAQQQQPIITGDSRILKHQDEHGEEETSLLQPMNEHQVEAVSTLNAVDKIIPQVMKSWKAVRSTSQLLPSEWLLEKIRATFSEQSHMYSFDVQLCLNKHKVLLTRYLDARDLVENDSGLLDISGRLQRVMSPVYKWTDMDQYEKDSTASSSLEKSVIWSESRHSTAGTVGEASHMQSSSLQHHFHKVRNPPSVAASDTRDNRIVPNWMTSTRGAWRWKNDEWRWEQDTPRTNDSPSETRETYVDDPILELVDSSQPRTFGDPNKLIEDVYGGHSAMEPANMSTSPYTYTPTYQKERTGAYEVSSAYYRAEPLPYETQPVVRKGATDADLSEIDTRFRVERSSRFQPGEVFKAIWAEAKATDSAAGSANSSLRTDGDEIRNSVGEFVTGFRRFIVVANDLGNSTCIPILTYGGRGCTKRGVKPEKHGIVYVKGQKPKLLESEPKLGFPPIKVELSVEGEKLDRTSRINYSKLVTVEHNVRVMFIGSVVADDWPSVQDAIDQCWAQKDHRKRRR
ncbi:hypothetical protein LIA77_04317 [Sarocladium implicatum]|nr:hypothetical protein LIA77_04317 [Sarocladium implicatum]